MDGEPWKLLAGSAVISALVSGLIALFSQERLLARKAQLDYELEAKKRLYEAVGPLRFQLLLAARDVVRRYSIHHERKWNMSPRAYYVKSCIYRLLAPLAVGQLIERRMSVVDFAVDSDAIDLLQFVTRAERMLTDHEVVLGHPDVDWSSQSQHLFRDNLRAAAHKLIVSYPGEPPRLMTFAEFNDIDDVLYTDALNELTSIFKKCKSSLTENAIFWARVVGYTYACSLHLKSRSGVALRFVARDLPIKNMIGATGDEHFIANLGSFEQRLQSIVSDGF